MKRNRIYKKYILCVIFILSTLLGMSCRDSQNPDETVISKITAESDTENDKFKDILYEMEKLESENSNIISEIDILRKELENIKDDYSVLNNSYSEKLNEIENLKIENDLLRSETDNLKSEIEEYEKEKNSEKAIESIQEVIPAPDVSTDVHTADIQITNDVKIQTDDIPYNSSESRTTVLYVLNKSTKKFHISTCSSVSSIKAENYAETYDRSYAVNNGYDECKKCNP